MCVLFSGPGLRQVLLQGLSQDDERRQRGQDPDQGEVHRPDHTSIQVQRGLAKVRDREK